uniref:Anillin, actin binding protein n=1 Tax=Gadus morhua TaxID=8049 RepID=A0A8C5D1A5_GADMO
MDPFTEKLLERTRARRENLQKKMAERPTAANRPMAKRSREPLADTNSLLTEPIMEKALHPSSKPSPSKRRCSEENPQPAPSAGAEEAENREPVVVPPAAPQDPPTDRKPPAGPASVRSAASLERRAGPTPSSAVRPPVQPPPPEPARGGRAQPEAMVIASDPGPEIAPSRSVEKPAPSRGQMEPAPSRGQMEPAPSRGQAEPAPSRGQAEPAPSRGQAEPAPSRGQAEPAPSRGQAASEGPEEAPGLTAAGMRSRLQKLAAQRNYWDNDTSDDVPLSPVKRQPEVAPQVTATAPSGAPVGRRGRLANLAATIGTWEDDLSHPAVAKDPPPAKPASTFMSRKPPQQSAAPSGGRPLPSSAQMGPSPVRSSRGAPASPLKSDVLKQTPAVSQSSPAPSPQKALNKAPMSPSPLKNQGPSRRLDSNAPNASPSKLDLPAKPARTDPSIPSRERVCVAAQASTTPQHQKASSGTPGAKSFLERFGEKCQERAHQGTPTGTGGTPAKNLSVTPNTRLVQDKLRAAQAASTTTSELTQRQKLERETELAQIRSRFQKAGNLWKNKEEASDGQRNRETKTPAQQPSECVSATSQGGAESSTLSSLTSAAGPGLSPPVSTSSPMRREEWPAPLADPQPRMEQEKSEEEEVETNVDSGSINSAVINELFEGVLEQSDDTSSSTGEEGDEEEDPLNISSMSLLTPLAETVASVIRSPDRRELMTSTPAGSFLEKSDASSSSSPTPSKFQRARVSRGQSTDDEGHKLLYSVDAYRSIRVKETERPHVKQVIVRNEDVSLRTAAAGPRAAGQEAGLKQRLKALTSDMNMQQTVIHQASQALNCCTDEEHGKGSPVEAEAQRLLLVATEKRLALKAELERLKGEGPSGQKRGAAGPSRAPLNTGVPASKGSITLQELRLPLKADFVCAAANKPESSSHFFFILIRAGAENMVATPLASTRSGLSGDALSFKTKFTMSDVSNDFEVDIQVYCLVMKREAANDKKKKTSKSKVIWRQVLDGHDLCMSAMTPKRFLAITKSSQAPVMASPGGPNAVHTSSFVLVGSHKLTLSSVGKNKFPLEKVKYEGRERELLSDMFHKKVPFLCPLEGHIHLKMQCQVGSSKVEERGFLTMFEDVSGFGSWHRRWCVLSGYCISYWTYPDDERRKNPMGRINLANCTSPRVEPANREFCARPNTLELITVRPQREDDHQTLVSHCSNTMCVTKNWLSADTKEERLLWMQKLNQILVDLRMWQPDSCLTPP